MEVGGEKRKMGKRLLGDQAGVEQFAALNTKESAQVNTVPESAWVDSNKSLLPASYT